MDPIEFVEDNDDISSEDFNVDNYFLLNGDRVIFFDDHFDQYTISKLVKKLFLLESVNHEPITLQLSSYGGEVEAFFKVYDIIQCLSSPVHVVASGMAMSAGLGLLVGATGKRFAYKNTGFLMHNMSVDETGRMDQVKDAHKYNEDVERKWLDVFEQHTLLSREQVEAKMLRETFFDSKTALEWGVIDGIL